MIIRPTNLNDARTIEIERQHDERGFFARVFCDDEMGSEGIDTQVAQCSVSWNEKRGTLRGLHYQKNDDQESKIVRVARGAIFDVIIDLRPESTTYKQWQSFELDSRRMLYVPKGFAHGYITLEDDTELFYWMSHPHVKDSEAGIAWDDPAFRIEWPMKPPRVISERDRSHPAWPG